MQTLDPCDPAAQIIVAGARVPDTDGLFRSPA
jgi:hypothetical protein